MQRQTAYGNHKIEAFENVYDPPLRMKIKKGGKQAIQNNSAIFLRFGSAQVVSDPLG